MGAERSERDDSPCDSDNVEVDSEEEGNVEEVVRRRLELSVCACGGGWRIVRESVLRRDGDDKDGDGAGNDDELEAFDDDAWEEEEEVAVTV